MPLLRDDKQRSSVNSILKLKAFKGKKEISELATILFGNAPGEDLSNIGTMRLSVGLSKANKSIKSYKRGNAHINFHNNIEDENGQESQILELLGDNKPFLFDSIMGALLQNDVDLQLVVHPVFNVLCDAKGKFKSFSTHQERKVTSQSTQRISLMQFYIAPLSAAQQREIKEQISEVLNAVSLVVQDWQPMLKRVDEMVQEYQTTPPKISKSDLNETIEFLNWLHDDNFTFLGMREYIFSGNQKTGSLKRSRRKGLGILQDPDVRILTRNGKAVTITPAIREFLLSTDPLFVSKANVRSIVHRQTYMDYIGVKRYDEKGKLVGELRIVGLFTSTAYTKSVKNIPLLRKKTQKVLGKFGYDEDSHSGKALTNVLESYPRDDFFQIDVPKLATFAQSILALGERPRTRVLSRVDRFARYVSILTFVPRDRYSSEIRMKIADMLAEAYDGRVSAYYPSFPEGSLARVHFIIGRPEGECPKVNDVDLERKVIEMTETWQDKLHALIQTQKDHFDRSKFNTLDDAFDAAYQSKNLPEQALRDLQTISNLKNKNEIAIEFHDRLVGRSSKNPSRIALKLFHPEKAAELSKRVPLLEHMGFNVINERTYRITPNSNQLIFMHEMLLSTKSGNPISLKQLKEKLEDGFLAAWHGEAEIDGFNALVLHSSLTWHEAVMLRALSRYLRQIRLPYTSDYVWGVLSRYPEIAKQLVAYFHKRFDPNNFKNLDQSSGKILAGIKNVENKIETLLNGVDSLDDDRIIRAFLDVMKALLRTNYYHDDTTHFGTRTWTFKINPKAIAIMPEPKPYRELFMYSPRVEGLHLRFGPVARGGLRWSDRAQDYRTEVLGLVKAQHVKNAVIVPVGSKGGFYPARIPSIIAAGGDRDAVFEEGKTSYKIYISSLLSLTDNLVDNKVIAPQNTVRYDGDDPYFVVAADKGTATFSDVANGISRDRGFWLDDAFASGGSAGYDHKVMGITARGGWEAVKRHFREMNHDIQTKPFTTVGVGDMSGDVFGNGMLLSRKTKLIAAFDHRDIFIDPNPDEEVSFKERERMFKLPRSTWQDYNKKLISKGGGVFSRREKSITLSKDAAAAIGLDKLKATPFEIMNAILKAKVDLLWFGGIGTYIRADNESNLDVGDRGNDAIRITAKEVGAKVIGEGANLGATQSARIEFNQLGGRCNSDAIDNSAGVNSSDVEVNIKIALSPAMKAKKITMAQRNKLLRQMTEEVAILVLDNNYHQTLTISLTEKKGFADFAYQKRFMQALEGRGLLDREVELLPDDLSLSEREAAGVPLTRAEIGVLLAYAKITLLDDLVDSDVPDAPYLEKELMNYFPKAMQKKFDKEIKSHRLRREIIATDLANSMINRGGPTYLVQTADQVGASAIDTAKVFLAIRDGYGLPKIYDQIDALDNKVDGDLQLELYARVQELLLEQSFWLLRHGNFSNGIANVVKNYQNALSALKGNLIAKLPNYMADIISSDVAHFVEGGVPKPLAEEIAGFLATARVPDIGYVALHTNTDLNVTADVYFKITEIFKVGRIKRASDDISTQDYYDGLALRRAVQILNEARLSITMNALNKAKSKKSSGPLIEAWLKTNAERIKRTQTSVDAIVEGETLSVSRLTVAANLLADFAIE